MTEEEKRREQWRRGQQRLRDRDGERLNDRRFERYHSDPEYRERVLRQKRERYAQGV